MRGSLTRLFCLLLAAAACLPRAAGAPGPTVALKAVDFLNSLGVCTHVAQGVDDSSKSAACLAFAGLRNLRDDGSLAHVPDWISIFKQSGVRTCLLTNHNVADTLTMAEQLKAAGALLAVEGPNEPNNWAVTYEGQTSGFNTTSLPIAHFQRDLYRAVKADPVLAGTPVFQSSEAGGAEKDNAGLQFLTIPGGAGALLPDGTRFADYANTHNYVCGHSGNLVDNVCWNATDPTLNADWDGLYGEYGLTWHGKFNGYTRDQLATLPRVCTETGWTTRGKGSISEEQQGRVFLNLYLDGFKRGWKYTFIYMLRDDPVQGYWGLFDTNYQPKVSGNYLHNMTTILADKGSPASPRKLAYSLPGAPATVHDLLLQKSDGTFALAVWDERAAGADTVTVKIDGAPASVKVYDPTAGTAPIRTLARVNTLALTLSDHPVILTIPATASRR